MTLNKNAILAANDMPLQKVSVPEWGGEVYLRPMSGTARAEFELRLVGAKKQSGEYIGPGMRGFILVNTLCDADGGLLFTAADIDAIESKNATVLARLVDDAMRISGLGGDDDENPLPETS